MLNRLQKNLQKIEPLARDRQPLAQNPQAKKIAALKQNLKVQGKKQ